MNKHYRNFGKFRMLNEIQPAEKPTEILMYSEIGGDPWSEQDRFTAADFKSLLDSLPVGKAICMRVNSRGGDVADGLAIKHLLEQWTGNTSAIIDGVAASTASWCCLGCKSITANKGAQMFMHDAWGMVSGNAEDLTKAAAQLSKTSDQIAGFYAEKCGKTQAEMRQMMKDETLLTAEEACKMKLIDSLTDKPAVRNFMPAELVAMKDKLRALNSATTLEAAKNNKPKPTDKIIMDKNKMIALLNKWGVTVPENATDEQLEKLIADGKPTTTPAASTTPAANVVPENILQIANELKALREARELERKNRIEGQIANLITADKLAESEREAEVKLCMADESRLTILNARQPVVIGAPAQPKFTEQNASPIECVNHFASFSKPMNAWKRGNAVSMKDLGAAASNRGAFFAKNKDRIIQAMNTNTIATELKRSVILQTAIVDFVRRLVILDQFSTVFQNIPLEGTNKVEVPFYDLDSTASTSWVDATGYVAGNTTTDKREIQIGNNGGNAALLCDRKYQALAFTSEEIARQPFLKIQQLVTLKAQKLAYDIVQHVMAVVTAANYGAAAITKQAALFDSDSIADLVNACKTWPTDGRTLILDTAYHAALLKDQAFKHALNAASDMAIKEGRLFPRVMGFDYVENPNVPANAENLVGFAAWRSGILCATAPVPPVEEVRNAGTTYEIITDPQTGISFEYRTFGDNAKDTGTHVIECSYGFAKGNANAVKRIVSQNS